MSESKSVGAGLAEFQPLNNAVPRPLAPNLGTHGARR